MSYINQEFLEGQMVTYKPYETETLLQVYHISSMDMWGNKSPIPIYHLGSRGYVTNRTTGKSIVESKYFEEMEGEGAY